MSLTIQHTRKDESTHKDDSSLHTFPDEKEQIVIGREGEKPIDLDLWPDTKVSRQHARLFRKFNTWYIVDLGSNFGTRINDKDWLTPGKERELHPGDRVALGPNTVLTLLFPPEESQPGTVDQTEIPRDEIGRPIDLAQDDKLRARVHFLNAVPNDMQDWTGKAPDGAGRSVELSRNDKLRAYEHFLTTVPTGTQAWDDLFNRMIKALKDAFPRADRGTIVLIEGASSDLQARAFWPNDMARYSRHLVRQTITEQEALIWRLDPGEKEQPTTFSAVTAMYAPMLWDHQVVGVIHVGSTRPDVVFTSKDRDTLVLLTNQFMFLVQSNDRKRIPKLPNIFVSYSHQNRAFVDRLADELTRRKIAVWYDEKLEHGDVWRKVVATAIKGSDAVLLVASPPAVASVEVNWELEIARKDSVQTLPVIYEDCDLPDLLVGVQYGHMHDSDPNFSQQVDSLIKTIINKTRGGSPL